MDTQNDNRAILEASYLLRRASERIKRLELEVMQQKLEAYERVFRLYEGKDRPIQDASYSFADELEKTGRFLEYKYGGRAEKAAE